MDFPFFVGYPPDPPDTHTETKSPPPPIIFLSLSLSFFLPPPSLPASITPTPPSRRYFLTASRRYFLTASRHHRLTLAFSLSFIVTKLQWCSLSLGVCLRKKSPSWGGSRSGETSPDLVRSRQI
uniref:Uncharacterized protein n=1 Tax=Fagus sylvatica TaxID=28930 RepID=A0A2N9H971_FAGSY